MQGSSVTTNNIDSVFYRCVKLSTLTSRHTHNRCISGFVRAGLLMRVISVRDYVLTMLSSQPDSRDATGVHGAQYINGETLQ